MTCLYSSTKHNSVNTYKNIPQTMFVHNCLRNPTGVVLTNCDEMLNFVNFKNGSTCVPLAIVDVMLRILINLLMAK